jgi:hypothetical protein
MEPLLAAARLEYQRTFETLEQMTGRLAFHRETDEPRYTQWLHTHFAQQMTTVRELGNRLHELDMLVTEVEYESIASGEPERRVYERLNALRTGAKEIEDILRERAARGEDVREEEFPPEVEKRLRLMFDQMMGGRNGLSKEEYEQIFNHFVADFREQMFGESGGASAKGRGKKRKRSRAEEDFEGFGRSEHGSSRKGRSSAKAKASDAQNDPDEVRRKHLYRTLARRLHPDANRELSARQKELWLEVQEAYETKNLNRLETLLAMIESEGGDEAIFGIMKIRSVARIKAIIMELGRKIRAAQKSLRTAKKSPAWDFHRVEQDPRRLKKLTQKVREDLKSTADELSYQIARLERKIDMWSHPRTWRRRGTGSATSQWDQY